MGVDWLQAAWTCSAGGGDGVDEGVAAFEAGRSATSSSFPGAGALDCDDAAGAEQAAAVTGSGFPAGASQGFTCSALFASLLAGLLVAFIPRTTSERRISVVVSPCTLTADPGRGGKLEAARSNFGDSGAAAFIKGAGLVGCSSSLFRRVFLWLPLLPNTGALGPPLGVCSLRPKEGMEKDTGVVPVSDSEWRGCGLKVAGRASISGVRAEGGTSPSLG